MALKTRIGIILIPACLLLGAAEAAPSVRELVRTVNYDLDIRIDYEKEKIEADCRITVMNPLDFSVDRIPLVLYRLMRVESVRDEHGRELAFRQQIVSYEDWEKLQANFIEVDLNRPLQTKATATLDIRYSGYLAGYVETGMPYVRDKVDPAYTVIRPDCWAYPQVGVPSWAVQRAAGLQEFDYTIRMTVPDSLTVANGGRLVEKTLQEGKATYVYQNILPSWRIDIAVADYGLLEDPEYGMRVYFFKEDDEGARRVLRAMRESMELFTSWFGPLAAESEFSVIAVPEGFGSQADVSAVLQTRDAFLDPRNLVGLYHEISHLWNVRPLDPAPSRFESEGLAMYLQFLAQEELEDRAGVLDESACRLFEFFRKRCGENPRLRDVPMIDYGKERLTNYSYSKGMLFFYLLHKKIGQEALLRAVGDFYQTHHATGATSREFLNHIAEATGLDLETFFQAWIFGTEAAREICGSQSFEDLVDKYVSR